MTKVGLRRREFIRLFGCTIFSFIATIWLQIATIHHLMLEKREEII